MVSSTTTVFLEPGTPSWTPPTGVTQLLSVECLGESGKSPGNGLAGGPGAGAYSAIYNYPVTPGVAVPCQVPAGGTATPTWFGSTTTVLADFGRTPTSSSGAAGGLAANSVGTTKYDGGGGGKGNTSGAHSGGGGGGAGGPNGPGKPGGDAANFGSATGGGGGGADGGSSTAGIGSAGVGTGGTGPTGAPGGLGATSSVAATAGSNGSGGGGGRDVTNPPGAAGSHNAEWDSTHGVGSGGGGSANTSFPGAGGGYGGAPGGAYAQLMAGRPGLIVITYSNQISATANIVLAPASTSSSSKLEIHGRTSGNLAAATLSATSKLGVAGRVNVRLRDAVAVGSGQLVDKGQVSATLRDATLSATGKVSLRSQANILLQDASVVARGGQADFNARVDGQLAGATLFAAGRLRNAGWLTAQLRDATLYTECRVGITGRANITLEDARPSPIMLTGDIIATGDQTIVVPATATATQAGPGLPLGSIGWMAALDPADRAPRAMDFTQLLAGAKIADVERITMSAAGAAVGLMVDGDPARQPIISIDGQRVQLWFLVDPELQDADAFSGTGVQVGISVKIQTDTAPAQYFERTGVLTVRQL